jgi:hypothetical protein
MKKIKNILYLVLLIIVVIYVVIETLELNSVYNKTSNMRKQMYLIEDVNIAKKGELIFCINNEKWGVKNELDKQLLDVGLAFKDKDLNKNKFRKSTLEIEFEAFSKEGDSVYNRMICNSYYKSNIKLYNKDYFGNVDNCDFNTILDLGLINNFSLEDIYIKLKIIVPDTALNKLKPNIIIRSNKKVLIGETLTVYLNQIFAIICLIALLILIIRDMIFIFKK